MLQFHSVVRDLSHKGLGVVDHPDGRVFFVRGVWPGDAGLFQISEDAQKYDEAKLVELTKVSKQRVDVPCPYRGVGPGKCGGCPWMIAEYPAQLDFKLKRLRHALEKRKLYPHLNPIIASDKIFNYRNRIQLKTNGQVLGYVSEGTSQIAPVEDCLILNKKLNEIFHQVRQTLPREDFKPTGSHTWSYLDLDDEMNFEDLKLNKRRPFKQGNTEQNSKMQEWIIQKFIDIPRHSPVIDLFCGSGNFTEVLSRMGFENILAVEVQGVALEELRKKKLVGVRVLDLDINEKGSWAKIAKHQPHAKAILIDPPREGLEKRKGLFKYLDNLQTIFYISCELDTFSRDAADFEKNLWKTEEITPLDLFPHTPHVEILSVFKKSGDVKDST
ncbi:MAG: class I SAM-dependent RNA methyltransferase [Bacteriovoracaceae bacterium]